MLELKLDVTERKIFLSHKNNGNTENKVFISYRAFFKKSSKSTIIFIVKVQKF
jgi:hypothetical protein